MYLLNTSRISPKTEVLNHISIFFFKSFMLLYIPLQLTEGAEQLIHLFFLVSDSELHILQMLFFEGCLKWQRHLMISHLLQMNTKNVNISFCSL